jgi:hypothetical protein
MIGRSRIAHFCHARKSGAQQVGERGQTKLWEQARLSDRDAIVIVSERNEIANV